MEKFVKNREIVLLNTGAKLTRVNGIWNLQVKDSGKTELPTEFGRNLHTAIMLTNGFARKYSGKVNVRTWTRAVLSKYQLLVDCHFFTARCLGLEAPFEFRRSLDYTAHKKFFPDDAYQNKTFDELNDLVDNIGGNVLVGQIADKNGRLTHSFFIVKIDGVPYAIEKPGESYLDFRTLRENYELWKPAYGTKFAISSYSDLARREDLQTYYTKYHGTAKLILFLPESRSNNVYELLLNCTCL